MKTYVIIVSPTFPSYHPRKGQQTYFIEKIKNALEDLMDLRHIGFQALDGSGSIQQRKIHTIRKNYPLWEKRMANVLKYEAVISLRCWELPGGCYTKGNKQIEIARLSADDNIGIQKIEFSKNGLYGMIKIDGGFPENTLGGYSITELSSNDGLSLLDFKDWFKGYDLSEPLAIIHFTPFRY